MYWQLETHSCSGLHRGAAADRRPMRSVERTVRMPQLSLSEKMAADASLARQLRRKFAGSRVPEYVGKQLLIEKII